MRPSIFYLDDETALLEIFQETFGGEYDVRTASAHGAACRALSEHGADIIISDQCMPEIEGADFLREVARLCPRSVRVMVSGYVTAGDLLGEMSAGIVNIFVPKPWTAEQMRQAIERASLALDTPAGRAAVTPRPRPPF